MPSTPNTRAQAYLSVFNSSTECSDNKKKMDDECAKTAQQPSAKELKGIPSMDAAAKARYKAPAGRNTWMDKHCTGLWSRPGADQIEDYGNPTQAEKDFVKNLRAQKTSNKAALVQIVQDLLKKGADFGGKAAKKVTMAAASKAASDLGTPASPMASQIDALKPVVKETDTALAKYRQEGMIAASGVQENLAKINPCITARRCQLTPYSQTKDSAKSAKKAEGCCPGQTGHHVLPGEMFGGCKEYKDLKLHDSAPTICVEGVNNTHGSHGKMHGAMQALMRKHSKTPEGKKDEITHDQAIASGTQSVKDVFPGCDSTCIEAQLKTYYKDVCKDKLKPRDGTPGGTAVEGSDDGVSTD